MKSFPDCFPKGFAPPGGSLFAAHKVYRVCKSGRITREDFLGSWEEVLKLGIVRKKPLDPESPGTYATSCFLVTDQLVNALKVVMKNNPPAVVAVGTTHPDCGPSYVNEDSGHVDWWIYEDSSPHDYFCLDTGATNYYREVIKK